MCWVISSWLMNADNDGANRLTRRCEIGTSKHHVFVHPLVKLQTLRLSSYFLRALWQLLMKTCGDLQKKKKGFRLRLTSGNTPNAKWIRILSSQRNAIIVLGSRLFINNLSIVLLGFFTLQTKHKIPSAFPKRLKRIFGFERQKETSYS